MATVQKFLPFDNSSQANFDAWVEGIHDAIVNTMGWVQTSDTGQAGTNPAVPSSTYIYRIYRMNDALQSTYPVFIKLEFGFSSTQVRMRWSVGTGSDGAGNLTGYVSGPHLMPGADVANQGSIGLECNFSGSNNRICMMLWRYPSVNGICWTFCIERTLASDGAPNSDGVTFLVFSSASSGTAPSMVWRTIVFASGLGNQHGRIPCVVRGDGSTSDVYNNQIPVSPGFPSYGKYGNPQTVCAVCSMDDVVEGQIVQTTLYGATRTYVCTKMLPYPRIGPGTQSTSLYGFLMRYD